MDPNLMTKPKPMRSFVWDHFEKSEDKLFVRCSICLSTLKYCGNTSNLRNHLKGKHEILEFGSDVNFVKPKTPPKKPRQIIEPAVEEEETLFKNFQTITGDYEIQDGTEEFVEATQVDDDDASIPEYLDEEEIIVEEIGENELPTNEPTELICRICLSHALSEYITEYHEHDIQATIINECTGINIDEPGTLNTICYTCVTSIRGAHQLRLTALESDATLKQRKLQKANADAGADNKPEIEVFDFFDQEAPEVDFISLPQQTSVKRVLVPPNIKQEFTTKRLTVKKLMVPKPKRPLKSEDEDIFDDEPLSNWCIVDETTKSTVDKKQKSKAKRAMAEGREPVKKKYAPAPLVCEICAKVCRGKRFLDEHMNTHTGARPKEQLPKKRKQFKAVCDICARVLLSKANFIEHMNAHNNLKTRQCPYCSMAFCYRNSLARHLLTHSGAKPKQCDQCSNTYRTTSHLKTHKLMAHGTLKDRKYSCNVCGKAFVQNFQLNAHLKEHAKQENLLKSDNPMKQVKYKVFIEPDPMIKFEEEVDKDSE